jgi:hypothetical protein
MLLGVGLAGCSTDGEKAADIAPGDVGARGEAVTEVPEARGGDAAGGDRATADSHGPKFEPLACPDIPGTKMSLAEKAQAMDEAATRWHLPPGQDWLFSVFLQDDLQTFDKVILSDNVGTWTALYAASQSFRYAATKDDQALQNLRRVVRGEHDMMKITGVPGLFARVVINPSLPGFPSGEQLLANYPDCDLSKKHCKRFNEVTDGPYKGLWFKNDVSKDEYAAHMFSMAVAWEIIDDPEVRERVADIVTQVGDHLVDNRLQITDIDGKVTLFGAMNAVGLDDFAGFDALLSLSWLRLAAAIGGEKYRVFYEECLLQGSGPKECIPADGKPAPYTDYFHMIGLDLACKTNWNNHNMAQLAMYPLIRFEEDALLKALYRRTLRDQLWAPDDPYPMRDQQKTVYTFMYLVNKESSDPWPDGPARDAICSLKRFRESKNHYPMDNLAKYPVECYDRSDEPMADFVIPVDEQEMDNFLWIGNPYRLEKDDGDPHIVESPEDYLLAYWMGRYYGFIGEED